MHLHIIISLLCATVFIGSMIIASIMAELMYTIKYWTYKNRVWDNELESNIITLQPNITITPYYITMNVTTPTGKFVYRKRYM